MNLNDFILDIPQVRRRKEKIRLLAEYSVEVRCVVHMYQKSELLPKDKWCDLCFYHSMLLAESSFICITNILVVALIYE